MILAIDFDGTIVEHRFPKIGEPAPGAFKWLKRFAELGAKLILFTMRSDCREGGFHPLSEAVEFCRRNGVEFWAVNQNPEQASWTSSPKVYAHKYIDDAAVGSPMWRTGSGALVVDWELIGPEIEAELIERQKKLAG